MTDELNPDELQPEDDQNQEDNNLGRVIPVSGMYKDWFLDYASYVILERAVPAVVDGLKPVHRRIMHSMKDLDDGRYNKVANIIGHTMKYHPHGDASIGDALVQLGQKDLLVDTQGNWGNTLTGDGAAAPRYIEARLSKFALEVVFNPKTTEWQLSYDGRNQEPVNLPVKFPLLLAQGAEGIAVGLACKILPHNFIELIDASIDLLRGKNPKIFPDFPNGGMADFSNYNDGLRGGRIRVRAKIKELDKKTLVISEIPFGTTTSSLIDSVIKANDRSKIKIRKIEDNTSDTAEIIVHLPAGTSPDKSIDALYAFTDCEVSISPNSCVITEDKPEFIGVSEILRRSTDRTVELLKLELQIRLAELQEQWHFSSLEKIFIENRIYRDIEEEETWEGVISAIDKGLKPHVKHLKREVTEEDIVRLTEIKIKRISKFDSFKADETIKKLEDAMAEVQHNLDNLIDFAIDFYKHLKKKYGEGRERKTEIRQFENIEATKVIAANKKLYVDREEGFAGWGMRKDEFVCDCSEIDDIIVFRADGTMMVTRIDNKKFVGKDIICIAVWKKGDKRTIYHMIYQDGTKGPAMVKRFSVTSITRDKEYDLTKGTKGTKVLYFSRNPNGVAEIVTVRLRPRPKLKKLRFDYDFAELAIRGRNAKGNRLTKNIVSKIELKEKGSSTLSARKIWYDETVNRLNVEERGKYLGSFSGDDRILTIAQDGTYKLTTFDLSTHFGEGMLIIEKWQPEKPISAVYYDGEREQYNVKRFLAEPTDKVTPFITEHEDSKLEVVSVLHSPSVLIQYDKRSADREDEVVNLREFIAVKGLGAMGNRLTQLKVKAFELQEPNTELEAKYEEEMQRDIQLEEARKNPELLGLDDDDEELDEETETEAADQNTDAAPENIAEKKPKTSTDKKPAQPESVKPDQKSEGGESEKAVTVEWTVGGDGSEISDKPDKAKPTSASEKPKKKAENKSKKKKPSSDDSQPTLF